MKGRPPLNPRIEALEEHIQWHAKIIDGLQQELLDKMTPKLTELEKRIDALLEICKSLNDSLKYGRKAGYEPLFNHWPGQDGR